MKRTDVIKHLKAYGCELLREGTNHAIYRNTANGKHTSVGRHPGIFSKNRICFIITNFIFSPFQL